MVDSSSSVVSEDSHDGMHKNLRYYVTNPSTEASIQNSNRNVPRLFKIRYVSTDLDRCTCCRLELRVGMKTDRIRTDITDIVFVFIFMSGFGFEYG
jgi:hypothetical protein